MQIRYNLFALKGQLELKNKREYSWREIAKKLGIHPNTMLNFVHNKIARVDIELLTNLVLYFRQEGLDIEFSDLFTITELPDGITEQKPSTDA